MNKLERQFVPELEDLFSRQDEMSFYDLAGAFKAVESPNCRGRRCAAPLLK
jgi:hypothetical protein